MEMVQPSKEIMGLQQVQNRCACSEVGQEATYVLGLTSGPQCTSNRRISLKVAEEGTLLNSTVEINTKDSEEDKRRQNQGSGVDYIIIANSVLVEPTNEDTTNEGTNNNETQSSMVLSRMDYVFQKRIADGLTIEDIDFLTQSTRKGTHKAYDH
jgi:hypothetical protein